MLLATSAMLSCGGETRAGADREDLGGGPGFYFGTTYGRDGRLAYAHLIDGKSAIFVADADGQNARRVSYGNWDFLPVWSPDGRWIAVGRDANGGDVVIVPSDSGAERIVGSTPSGEGPLDWMPDGSALLFRTTTPAGAGETWIYDLASGKSEKFINVGGSAVGYPAPDGNLIGYVLRDAGKSTIWLWDRAANTHRQLTTEGFEGINSRPFSADGRSLVYTSNRTGTPDLWRIDVASGDLAQLTRDIGSDFNPQWSPDGSRILFQSNRGGQPDLWVLSSGESDVQRVTDDALGENEASWSPDGRSIVMTGGTGFFHAHVVPLDGSPAVPRTSGDFNVLDLNVSADGELIAYSGTKNGDADVWVVPAGEGEPRLVSAAPGFDGGVHISPDGNEIAFVSDRGGTADIWVVPTAGGEARRLTAWPSNENSPRWTPDGRSIHFLSTHESRGTDLWTVSAAGGAPVRLTTLGTVNAFTLSPDGNSIALGAESAASRGAAVFTLPLTGGTPRLLAPAHSGGPVWSRDGSEIGVQRTADGYGVVEIYSRAGSLLRKLSVEEKVYESLRAWSADGSRVIVGYQDLFGDGGNRLVIQSAAGGPRTPLAPGPGFRVGDLSFARTADVMVAAIGPVGSLMVRIAIP